MAKKGTTENTTELCLLSKINKIRESWSKIETIKEGQGKAGGGAKYDYYKPQQIIDFCLSQELTHDLFSEFFISPETNNCYYQVTDISTGEVKNVNCEFKIPDKMAASASQQVGAALTYFNRRLAMMMYKIEDNSKESLKVFDVEPREQNIPAPVIPPAPAAPSVAQEVIPPLPQQEELSLKEWTKFQVSNIQATIPAHAIAPPPAQEEIKGEPQEKKLIPPLPTIIQKGEKTTVPGIPLSAPESEKVHEPMQTSMPETEIASQIMDEQPLRQVSPEDYVKSIGGNTKGMGDIEGLYS